MNAVISGIGRTALSRASGRSPLELAVDAVLGALDDAGLDPGELDGVGSYHETTQSSPMPSPPLWSGPPGLECQLVTRRLRYGGDHRSSGPGRGDRGSRACSGLSGHERLLGSPHGRPGRRGIDRFRANFTRPYGYGTPAQWYGMACRRHMHQYGTTPEVLGRIAVTQRAYANDNPGAVMYLQPMTMEDYLASPMVVDPFRLFDCCQETDGAVAIVVSPAGTAPSREVDILTAAYASGPCSEPPYERYADMTVMFPYWLRRRLFGAIGMIPADIDLAYLYDAFTFGVLCQLEDFGFFQKGEAAAWVLDGLGTERPFVNTNGGLLSEGYVHGLNNVLEAVTQFRGEAGARRSSPLELPWYRDLATRRGSALILARR